MSNQRSQGGRVLDGVLNTAGAYQQITNTGTAQNISNPPDGTETVVMFAEGGDIRWTDDGLTTPTSSLGMLLKQNSTFVYNGPLSKFQFVAASGSAILNVSFYT